MKILLFLLIIILQNTNFCNCCNEAVCASIVSKCMIMESCNCDLTNCTCCKDCFNCLSHLYAECCSCVEMCPKPNNTISSLSKQSHVEDLSESVPTLFQSLIEEPNTFERWRVLTFPIDFNIHTTDMKKDVALVIKTNEQELNPVKDMITFNCSVAYMNQCMPWNKCKATCSSMGAKSYRWFHDGCCECVGEKCINYGINESRCSECHSELLDDFQSDSTDELDFGEDDDIMID